ncbi:MAG: peptide chain release factor N(5)-glutamine methyltransferase [Pseudolabrys sp.]
MTRKATARSIADARRALTDSFRQAGLDSPDTDARLLVAQALGIGRTELLANSGRIISADQMKAIDALAARRLKYEPVARILGVKEFWSLSLLVNEAVLVPRPETETLIETALDFAVRNGLMLERLRVLDIGTGSGALLLALLTEFANATGTGTDISEAALTIARANAERIFLGARCTFVKCDIGQGLSGPFDLIVSNPPYIVHGDIAGLAPDVREYDPAIALDGGTDGLDAYRAIAAQAPKLLAPGGRLIVELGAGQEPSVAALFTKAGLTVSPALNDLSGIPRALSAKIAS